MGRASPRSWGSEMEGCVSNLMICNLAYTGNLEELKERILADKSLATRIDQVKQRRGLSVTGDGGLNVLRGCPAKLRPAPCGPTSSPCASSLPRGSIQDSQSDGSSQSCRPQIIFFRIEFAKS